MSKITQELLKEHEAVEKVVKWVEGIRLGEGKKARERLKKALDFFSVLLLDIHFPSEEVLFPLVKKWGILSDDTWWKRLSDQHFSISRAIEKAHVALDMIEMGEVRLTRRLKVLLKELFLNLRDHMEEEEAVFYRIVETLPHRDDIHSLFQRARKGRGLKDLFQSFPDLFAEVGS